MKAKFVRAAVAVVAVAAASMVQVSAFVWNGHEYEVVTGGQGDSSWGATEAAAVAWGGHLVTINDAAEEAWLRETFGQREYFWIGYTDQDIEDKWTWISGEEVTYSNWNDGEPNNSTPPDWGEDYAVLNWNVETGAWNDWDSQRPDYYPIWGIAEKGAAVPDAGSMLLLVSLGALGLASLRRK